MLLRESSQAIGQSTRLDAAVGEGQGGGIPNGDVLVEFGEAVTRGSEDVGQARADLIHAVGPEAFVVASAIVGIFNGLVRTADATGIPLDDGTRAASAEFRRDLGLNAFPGAANTEAAETEPVAEAADTRRMFR